MSTPSDSTLDRVQKLLNIAAEHDRSGSHAERDAALHRADEIMNRHQIDQAVLDARKVLRGEAPREIVRMDLDLPKNEWTPFILELMRSFAAHGSVSVARIHQFDSRSDKVALVGFSDDIEYVRQLWLGAMNTMLTNISPGWDASLTFDRNVKRLKDAAYKWVEIARLANSNGHSGSTANGAWLRNAYARQCRSEGVEPTRQTQRHGAYKISYVRGFSYEVDFRLRNLAKEREKAERNDESYRSSGTDLAVQSASDRVKAEFYRIFPDLSPEYQKERLERLNKNWLDRLAKMTPDEKKAYEKRQRRFDKEYSYRSNLQYDESGLLAGQKAADKVDLFGSRNKVGDDRKFIEGE